jgi:hypothetical protein
MQFEVGHYYRWIGGDTDRYTRDSQSLDFKDKRKMLDGVPRKVVSASISMNPEYRSVEIQGLVAVGNWHPDNFEEVPLLYTIDTADWLSTATKDYSRQAIIDCVMGKNGKRVDADAKDFDWFVEWSTTKEGELWWLALDNGKDPGVPGAIKSYPQCYPELHEISTIPVGTRVKLVSYDKNDRYKKEHPELVGKSGSVFEKGKYGGKEATGIIFDGPYEMTIDNGAMCEILSPVSNVPEPDFRAWRILGPDEIIQRGDECRYKNRENHDDDWSPTGMAGKTVSVSPQLDYRRRIVSPATSIPSGKKKFVYTPVSRTSERRTRVLASIKTDE